MVRYIIVCALQAFKKRFDPERFGSLWAYFPITMSLIQMMFGGKNKESCPTTNEAIQKLKDTEALLEKKQEYLEKKIDHEKEIAKKNAQKNKRVALQALKRKRRYDKQLTQIDGALSTLEFQRDALENANTNTAVLKNMSYAAKALKEAHRKLDVDDVHDIMDDIQEQTQIADEILQAVSSAGYQDFDEDELNAELDLLEQADLDDTLLNVDTPTLDLPSVPTEELKKKKVQAEDDDDLAQLEAWAS